MAQPHDTQVKPALADAVPDTIPTELGPQVTPIELDSANKGSDPIPTLAQNATTSQPLQSTSLASTANGSVANVLATDPNDPSGTMDTQLDKPSSTDPLAVTAPATTAEPTALPTADSKPANNSKLPLPMVGTTLPTTWRDGTERKTFALCA